MQPPLPLQVETDQAALSQDVASQRIARFMWTGTGFAVLLLIGISANAFVPLASHASAKPSRLVPEAAFNPSLPALSPGGIRLSGRERPTGFRPVALPVNRRIPGVMLAKKAAVKKDVMVLLTDDITNVGRKGEVIGVKPAYAQNFVIGQGLGKMATPDVLAQLEKDKANKAAAAIAAKEGAEALKVKLDEVFGSTDGAVIKKKVGPSGDIFGKVTSADLAQHIKERTGLVVDKKLITLPAIKGVGCATAELALHKEVPYSMKLAVVADTSDGEGGSPEECFV